MSSDDPPPRSQPAQSNAGTSSAEQTPSVTRPLRDPAPSSDTLLSVPTPASREDLLLDERLSASEQKLQEHEARIEALERRPAAGPSQSSNSHWFWLVFLAGLAVAWQIVEHFR